MFLGRRSLGEGGYKAKTFSTSRRVRNHYSKRILNLILNRKKILRRENVTLGNLIRGKTAASPRRARLRLSNGYHVKWLARRKKLVGKSREVFCHSIRTIGLRKDKQRRFEAV